MIDTLLLNWNIYWFMIDIKHHQTRFIAADWNLECDFGNRKKKSVDGNCEIGNWWPLLIIILRYKGRHRRMIPSTPEFLLSLLSPRGRSPQIVADEKLRNKRREYWPVHSYRDQNTSHPHIILICMCIIHRYMYVYRYVILYNSQLQKGTGSSFLLSGPSNRCTGS